MSKPLAFTGAIVVSFVGGLLVSGAFRGPDAGGYAAAEPFLTVPTAALKSWLPPISDYDNGGEPLDDKRFEALMAALEEAVTAEETLADFGREADLHLWNFLRRLAIPELTEEQTERVSAYLAELSERHPDHAGMISRNAGQMASYAAAFPSVPPFSISSALLGDPTLLTDLDVLSSGGKPWEDSDVDGLLAWLDAVVTSPETANDFESEASMLFFFFTMLLQLGEPTDAQTARVVDYLEGVKADHPDAAEAIDKELHLIRNLTPGRMAPNIVGTDTDGDEFELEEYRGNMVVLIFSGQWCGPCRGEYPYHRFILENYEDRPVVLLGINSDAELETIQKAKIDERLPYRTWWDGHEENSTQGPIATAWNVTGWPTIYILDEEGVIRYVNKRGGALISAVDKMLMERQMREMEADGAAAATAADAETDTDADTEEDGDAER
jgi:peroxiredoxin